MGGTVWVNSGRGIVETVLKIGRCALGGPLQQNSTLPNWGCMRCMVEGTPN